jgi:hypothetical protein
MSSDDEIQAAIQNPATSYWLRDALKASIHRDPIDVATDAETLAAIFTKRAQEHAA